MYLIPDPDHEGLWLIEAGDVPGLPGWIASASDPRLTALWAGAEDYGDDDLLLPLSAAAIQCAEFAPDLPEGTPVPTNWIAAQVLQTRALVRAGIVGSGDQAGGYGETVTLFPMDWVVKGLLRPRHGKPHLGGRRAS